MGVGAIAPVFTYMASRTRAVAVRPPPDHSDLGPEPGEARTPSGISDPAGVPWCLGPLHGTRPSSPMSQGRAHLDSGSQMEATYRAGGCAAHDQPIGAPGSEPRASARGFQPHLGERRRRRHPRRSGRSRETCVQGKASDAPALPGSCRRGKTGGYIPSSRAGGVRPGSARRRRRA